jgi:DNA-binding CsgD family transcriptional regulator
MRASAPSQSGTHLLPWARSRVLQEHSRLVDLHAHLVSGLRSVSGGAAGFCYVGSYLGSDRVLGSCWRDGSVDPLPLISLRHLEELLVDEQLQKPVTRYAAGDEPWNAAVRLVLRTAHASHTCEDALIVPLMNGSKLSGVIGATLDCRHSRAYALRRLEGLTPALDLLSSTFLERLELERWVDVTRELGSFDGVCCVIDIELQELVWVGSCGRHSEADDRIRRCAPHLVRLAERCAHRGMNDPPVSYPRLDGGVVIKVLPSVDLTTFNGRFAVIAVRNTDESESTRPDELSKRERQIARLLVAGYTSLNTAAIMGLSENTVRTYVRRLYRKLGVNSRTELVRRLDEECR